MILGARRRRKLAEEADAEHRKRERKEADEAREREEDELWAALVDQAWMLTDQADMLGMQLQIAANTSAERFEEVRQAVEEFLSSLSPTETPGVYLGHLEGWLMLFGLDPATAKRRGI